MTRDTLFISHATPEDNEFAIWLASRLEMLGYKIWVDKEKLLGGETFWQIIQNVIKNDTIKILLVYSENICDKNGNLREGINKELAYAESIAKSENIKDFILPLHISKDASFNKFIGANILVHIPFSENWAKGLNQLKKKLEQNSVPLDAKQFTSSFANWYEEKYNAECAVIKKKEQLFSSWWKISDFPDIIYIYIFKNKILADKVKEKNTYIPIGIVNNIISSFENDLDLTVNYELGNYEIKPDRLLSYSVSDIINGFESNTFPHHRDVKNYFINLLYSVITTVFTNKGLLPYELSNGTAYFLPKNDGFSKINFIYPNTLIKKKKTIGGSYLDIGYWHYGISVKPLLFPILGYSIKSHIIFTSDGQNIIPDIKKQHSYRRNKGKKIFNDVWRSMQLAFIQNLKDPMGNIQVVVGKENAIIRIEEWPVIFTSDFGYNDPNSMNDNNDDVENDFEGQLMDEEEQQFEEVTDERS
jgi:hypothetical protein